MKKRILVIDGMYYCNRTLGGMRAEDETFTLDTRLQQEAFKTQLHNSLVNLVESFNNERQNLIHNVLFITDFDSWRKRVTPFIPKYYRDLKATNPGDVPPLGYKENRKEKKEESPVNYEAFYKMCSEFNEELSKHMPFISIRGCEGDDIIMLLSKTYQKSENYELLVFCTDGDLIQCVNDNTMLFRNIRSGASPAGEFVISYPKFHELYIASNMNNPATKLLKSSINDYFTLFKMQLNNEYPIDRKPNVSIHYATPVSLALKKCICGDDKDNIFPILRKFTETRKRSISEKELIKTFEMIVGKYNEKNCFEVFTNKDVREELFVTLRSVFKLETYPIKEMEDHFQHNQRINVLSPKNLDRELVEAFVEKLKTLKEQIETPIGRLKRVQSIGKDILAQSVPDCVLD